MSETLIERLRIHDICAKFEKEHPAEVIVTVEPALEKHQWIISMVAAGFTPDGKFSKETYRTVIFKRLDPEYVVTDALNEMYAELYDV